MSLSPAVEREHIHTRAYDFRGYRRRDGLWDIEGHLTDTKSYGFSSDARGRVEAGEPIHDMWIRITVDDAFKVHDIEVVTVASPYSVCPAITENYKSIIGATLGAGWRRAVRERVGGTGGCTHQSELLGAIGTAAFQTIYPILARELREGNDPKTRQRPALIDSCHAFRSDGAVVRQFWPQHYTGPEEPA